MQGVKKHTDIKLYDKIKITDYGKQRMCYALLPVLIAVSLVLSIQS